MELFNVRIEVVDFLLQIVDFEPIAVLNVDMQLVQLAPEL